MMMMMTLSLRVHPTMYMSLPRLNGCARIVLDFFKDFSQEHIIHGFGGYMVILWPGNPSQFALHHAISPRLSKPFIGIGPIRWADA